MQNLTSANNNSLIKDKLTLADDDIHIWVTTPDQFIEATSDNLSLLEQYAELLTKEETTKQQRYKFAKDKHDALITRAFVRDLLSYYADVEPKDWRFDKGEKDKPELVNAPRPLRFNLSHTRGLIICAVTLTNDIGCDVEDISRNNDVLAIASRYFSTKETSELFSLPQENQRSRFFDYWTLKESYIKAWGLGLAIPLADFTFTINDKATLPTTSHINTNDICQSFTMKSDITLSFAEHRVDQPTIWRSWIIYPTGSEKHRIALSIRSQNDITKTEFSLRFFNSTPLCGYQELK
jgi:4'-phosphopantetheinyl transferase